MEQLSRPYQIALGALAVFALVWFVALHRPGSGSGSASSSSPAPVAASKAASPAAPSHVYHGAAPGVAGLTRAIAKAHGAVAQSQQNAATLQDKSAQASGEATATATAPASATPNGSAAASASTSAGAPTSASTSKSDAHQPSSTPAKASSKQGARATALAHELAHGKVVVLMFWDSRASDDRATRSQLQQLSRHEKGIAVHYARAGEVASFGGYTRGVQVLQTPTILVIDRAGQAETLTGLTDASSIRQTIANARQGGAGSVQAPKFTAWTPASGRAKAISTAHKVFCGKANKLSASVITTRAQLAQALTQYTQFTQERFAKIEQSAPAADRPFIKRMSVLYAAGIAKLRQALSAHTPLQVRALVFSGEAKLNEATDGIARYGFEDC